MQPRVSILMPVHNGEKHLAQAIESMLSQTYSDFEFIIIDDGSTDATGDIIDSYARNDPRIITRHLGKSGLVGSLNSGLSMCRGEFIARMDGDDISLPDRLDAQVTFMDAHQDVAVLGTCVEVMDQDGHLVQQIRTPETHEELVWRFAFGNAIAHPSAFIRKEAITAVGNYSDEYPAVEDYDLWCRFVRNGYRLSNLQAYLLRYRQHPGQVSQANTTQQSKNATEIATHHCNWLCNCSFTGKEVLAAKGIIEGWDSSMSRELAVRAASLILKLARSLNGQIAHPASNTTIQLFSSQLRRAAQVNFKSQPQASLAFLAHALEVSKLRPTA